MNRAAVLAGLSFVAVGVAGVVLASVGRRSTLGRAGRRPRRGLTPDFEVRGDGGQVVKGYRKEDMSIRERLELMQGMVAADVRNGEMRRLALQVTSKCAERDDACEMRAIYAFVKRRVRYTGDVAPHKLWPGGPVDSVDLYASGRRTLENGGGDCDDQTVLVASLATLNGIPAKFRATSPSKLGRNNYTHVYPVLGYPKNDPEKWIACDTTLPGDDNFGREHSYAKAVDVVA